MRLAICVGHNPADPGVVVEVKRGADVVRLREYDLCYEIADVLVPALRRAGITIFEPPSDRLRLPYPDYLNNVIEEINREGVSGAVELHLNSPGENPDPEINYALALHTRGIPDAVKLAQALSIEFHMALLPYMGKYNPLAKPDNWTGGRKGFCAYTQPWGVIGEPCFLTNAKLQAWIVEDRKDFVGTVAEAYRLGIVAWVTRQEAKLAPRVGASMTGGAEPEPGRTA